MSTFQQRRNRFFRYPYTIREGVDFDTFEDTADLYVLGFSDTKPVLTAVKDERQNTNRRIRQHASAQTATTTATVLSPDHDYTAISGPSYTFPLIFDKKRTHNLWEIHFFDDLKNCITFDCQGNLPLHRAILESNVCTVLRQCIAIYIRRRSVDIYNFQILTPLQFAIKHDSCYEILQILITHHSDVNVVDGEGNTIVHLAVLYLNEATFQIMMSLTSLDLNISNYRGDTPLILCACNRKWEHAVILLSHGADPNLGNLGSGCCPLFHAIKANDLIMVKKLLEHGASIHARNFKGVTPLDIIDQLDTVAIAIKNIIFQNARLKKGTSLLPK